MDQNNFSPFITEIEIRLRITQLARQIASDYDGQDFVVISVLKGAFMFAADLLRRLYDQGARPETDFIRVSSYGKGTKSSGTINIGFDIAVNLKGRRVLLIDDIADSGRTLNFLENYLKEKKQASDVKTCVLLDKPSRRINDFQPDYIGFEIPNVFVIGYGIDFAESYRYLPFISTIKSSDE